MVDELMTLRRLSLISILCGISILIAAQYFFAIKILDERFHQLEMKEAGESLDRLNKSLNYQIDVMYEKGVDWSLWDDTYKFIKDHNTQFITSNLSTSTWANQKVDLIMFIDLNGEIVWGKKIDKVEMKSLDLTSDVKDFLNKHRELYRHPPNSKGKKGLIMFSDGEEYLFVAQPILPTNANGPNRGSFLIARKLDKDFKEHIAYLTGLDIKLVKANATREANSFLEYLDFYNNVKNDMSIYYKYISDDSLMVFSNIKDYLGNDLYYFNISIDRSMHRQGKKTSNSLMYLILIGGLLLCCIVLVFLDKIVISPITNLAELITDIKGSGNLSLRIPVSGKNEISKLGLVFNQMMETIQTSKNELKLLLDNVHQGLIYFDEKGVIGREYSKASVDIFEMIPANLQLSDILHLDNAKTNSEVKVLFGDALDFEDLIIVMTKAVNINNKIIELNYYPINDDNEKLSYVMMIATDVTEVKKLEQQSEEQKKINSTLIRILTKKTFFNEVLEDVENLQSDVNDSEAYLRRLHTLKGSFGFIFFDEMVFLCHSWEESLKKSLPEHFSNVAQESLEDIKTKLSDFVDKYENILHTEDKKEKNISISFNSLQLLSQKAEVLNAPAELKNEIKKLFEKPIQEILGWMSEQFVKSAEVLGKEVGPIEWEEVETVNPELYKDLFKSLIHIVKNSADHGIEYPYERVKIGKPRNGQMKASLKCIGEFYELIISDDGAGVDIDELKTKASTLGLEIPRTDNEILDLIFSSGFSTKKTISENSGRGVGLNVVRYEAKKLGGNVIATSIFGKGVRFRIQFKKVLF
jgi:sensor domain CHASE-containing protein/signal transduction histidine kinase